MRAFSNGSEFTDWMSSNCYQCRKYKENLKMSCKYETKLAEAYMDTGEITDKEAKVMGLDTDKRECTIRVHSSEPREKRPKKQVKFKFDI